ncbi:MAG TPA: transglutaminaseTgpA domain-containing protein [Urbifossiella sp.]|jgi:hypothetical protein
MLPSTEFRLSTYITFAIACAALGQAESEMFPEVGLFAIVVILALALIYRLETRVRLLSLPEANRLGVGIAVATILWAGFRVVREFRSGEYEGLGWPGFFISLMGPLLMASVCGKLLRREKHAGDYWFLHAAGLAAMVLAGAMAENTLLAALIAAYAVSAVWSLSQFFEARSSGTVPLIPTAKSAPASTNPSRTIISTGPPPRWRSGLLHALLWTGLAAAVVVPIYLLTPRSSFGKLDFGQPRIEIGYAADQMIDLTKTGELHDNPEIAFELASLDSRGRPKEDLNPEQRWRGVVLINYSHGAWKRDAQTPLPTVPITSPQDGPWVPPDFGIEGYQLAFSVPTQLRSPFLAEPPAWIAGAEASVADVDADGTQEAWFPFKNGTVFGRTTALRAAGSEFRYVQIMRPPIENDLSQPYPGNWEPNHRIVSCSIASVKEYADEALEEMAAAGRIPREALVRDPVSLLPDEHHHETIARAFRDYLSERSDLAYTTSLKRDNKKVDPVEDFLFYTKAGHCERFASALVLLLRSEGIPAVLVLGFKGCEHTGGGHYLVRQEFAHAWAEAYVARPDPTGFSRRVWHALTLDPSPARTADAEAGDKGNRLFDWRRIMDRYVFHYTPEQRQQAIRSFIEFVTRAAFLSGAAIVVLAWVVVRYRRRWMRKKRGAILPGSTRWFDQLIAVLAAHEITPLPGMTAREFAAFAAATLQRRPHTAEFAQVPLDWAEAYYRDRFGGTEIAAEKRRELEADLESLRRALERKQGSDS